MRQQLDEDKLVMFLAEGFGLDFGSGRIFVNKIFLVKEGRSTALFEVDDGREISIADVGDGWEIELLDAKVSVDGFEEEIEKDVNGVRIEIHWARKVDYFGPQENIYS